MNFYWASEKQFLRRVQLHKAEILYSLCKTGVHDSLKYGISCVRSTEEFFIAQVIFISPFRIGGKRGHWRIIGSRLHLFALRWRLNRDGEPAVQRARSLFDATLRLRDGAPAWCTTVRLPR